MKRILLPLLAATMLASVAYATLSNAGGMANWKSQKDDNGNVTFNVVNVNPSGTPFPTPAGGSGSAVVVTNTTPIPVTQASPTPGIMPVSITANTSISSSGTQGFTWTLTPVAQLISPVAGVSGTGYIVRMQSLAGPCSSAMFEIVPSATPTSAFTSGWGTYLSVSPSGGLAYGPYDSGFYLIGKSNSSTNCNGSWVVEAKQ